MEKTTQEKFWNNEFGKSYTDRNEWISDEDWDKTYRDTWGYSKLEINELVMKDLPRDIKILEVGCNQGFQLRGYQRMGFCNLYGVELQSYAVEKSKKRFSNLNIIKGSGFDLPFKDGFFDLVCTNNVLIHIAPTDHNKFMSEVFRCSNKFIMGWEYYNNHTIEVQYRNNTNCMWKGDYATIYRNSFPSLSLVDQHMIKYTSNVNVDAIFLLQK
jgi:pseudaminic acid biosynthesis-associated methylase